MQIKRFEAPDIQEALRQVKEALGPEAIILSTKTVKKPTDRFRLAKQSTVEVVAATDLQVGAPIKMPRESRALSPPAPLPKTGLKPNPDDPYLQRFLSAGISPEFVSGLIEEIRTWQKESGGWKGPEMYQDYLRWRLMDAVEVTGPELNGAKIWAFIGPTGVGKTTTPAKLAAHFSLRFHKKITLITIDTYRIGAVEQLKTYARILKLPLEIAPGREELKQIIQDHRHQDLLLIDTAGRNPHHPSQVEELRNFLSVDRRVENHLVLSATTKDADLAQIAQRFSLLPIQSYIFTKIDETEEFTSLFNQLLRFKRPLSYLTNGQKVPEDIELATKGRIANLVLNQIPWN
jgi:flagellar biosynthesis protein FlhF